MLKNLFKKIFNLFYKIYGIVLSLIPEFFYKYIIEILNDFGCKKRFEMKQLDCFISSK